MGAPGIGTGRAGVWRAGVEVEGARQGLFALQASAEFLIVGGRPAYLGAFGLDGNAELTLFGRSDITPGYMPLAGSAVLGWEGQSTIEAAFALEAVASGTFYGNYFPEEPDFFGAFHLASSGDLDFFGAEVQVGTFALAGSADLWFFKTPDLGPPGGSAGGYIGSASAGCFEGLFTATDIDDPADAEKVGGVPGAIVTPTEGDTDA